MNEELPTPNPVVAYEKYIEQIHITLDLLHSNEDKYDFLDLLIGELENLIESPSLLL